MKPVISVVLCTHNPRLDFLQRTLQALREQSLPTEQWELLIVDNASQESVEKKVEICWHPHARVVVEHAVGLTRARQRGIAEARSQLICFVDDDNLLHPRYLERALEIASQRHDLGAWGGEILPEYEVRPDASLEKYAPLLAIHLVERDLWANFPQGVCLPRGAGLVVRKIVCEEYSHKLSGCLWRAKLGRAGKQLTSCEDTDLCYCAFDLGLGVGVFKGLQLIHIIPKERISLSYLLKLEEGMSYSWTVLDYLYGKHEVLASPAPLQSIAAFIRWLPLNVIDKRFCAASLSGKRKARKLLRESQP